MLKCDVAIIGGGPAGSTVGTLLKKYNPSLRVVIVEREKFPRDHVGESHLPAISRILDEMGVWDKVEAADFPIKVGGTYRWGATDELWDLDFLDGKAFKEEPRPAQYINQRRQTAFQVDRSIYDKVLLDHARSMDCEVYEETKVVNVDLSGKTIRGLQTSSDHAELGDGRIEARYYVDCSGDAGILRKALGIEIEAPTALRNIAIWDYWQDAEWAVSIGNGGTRIQIMSLGWGWLWFIPVTPTRTSVGLVLPAAYYKASGKTKEQIYADAIQSEPLISRLVANAQQEGNLEATKDWNFLAKELGGANWFLAGDTAGFADPILSAGMTLAHTSGRKAAYTILELDRGNLDSTWLKKEYNDGHRTQIRHHMQFADFWYSANGRFTDLKEYCTEIAQNAGLTLDADSAFRWLATGGFAVEEPGIARALGYRVAGIKIVAERLAGSRATWEMSKTNFWRLNLKDAVEENFASYVEGRIVPLRCFRREDKLLPVSGVYEHVISGLSRNMDGVMILEDCVNAMVREDGCEPNEAAMLVSEAIEAMVTEGWIKSKAVASRPFIKMKQPSTIR